MAISVDVGTSVIKAVGYDDDGHEQAVARRTCAVARPRPGHASRTWRRYAASCTRRSARPPSPSVADVGLVSVTAQGDGCWLVDSVRRAHRHRHALERRPRRRAGGALAGERRPAHRLRALGVDDLPRAVQRAAGLVRRARARAPRARRGGALLRRVGPRRPDRPGRHRLDRRLGTVPAGRGERLGRGPLRALRPGLGAPPLPRPPRRGRPGRPGVHRGRGRSSASTRTPGS